MKKAKKRIAIVVSILFHVMLLVVLWFWYLPNDRGVNRKIPSNDSPGSYDNPSSRGGHAEDRMQQIAAAPASVSAQELQKSVESQIQQAKKLPDERKLSELESNLKRLESIAKEESVREVSSSIADALGLDSNQYQRTHENTEGVIDTDSAQITDVVRSKNSQGQWQYESVMVDAEGRTSRVSIGADDGATLYETFELLKRYPMAQGVYTSVVMPMMQRILEAEKAAAASARHAIRESRSQQQNVALGSDSD